MTYYNWRLTGDPLLPPQRAHDSHYATTGYSLLTLFFGPDEPEEKTYNHQVLRDLWVDSSREKVEAWGSPTGFLFRRLTNFYEGLRLFVAPVFMIPFLALPNLRRDRRVLLPSITVASFIFLLNFEANPQPHYAAPVLGLLCLLGVRATAYLCCWKEEGKPTGQALVRALALICPVALMLCVTNMGLGSAQDAPFEYYDRCLEGYLQHPVANRQTIQTELEHQGGRHLVFVRYSADHDVGQEWVYNRADVDNAKVIWAREMTPERNRRLIDYFRDRDVWLLEPDLKTVALKPHPEGPE